jgi:ATP-dependent protease ClpP protease subunit
MTIQNTNVTTVASNIFAPSGDSVVVTAYFCNYSNATKTVNVYAVPSGGSVGSGTQILANLSISSGDTYIMTNERLVLGAGEALAANANANSSITSTVVYTGV